MSPNALHYLLWALWLVPAVLMFFYILDDMKSGGADWKEAQDSMGAAGWSKTTQTVVTFVIIMFACLLWPLTMIYGLATGPKNKKK